MNRKRRGSLFSKICDFEKLNFMIVVFYFCNSSGFKGVDTIQSLLQFTAHTVYHSKLSAASYVPHLPALLLSAH